MRQEVWTKALEALRTEHEVHQAVDIIWPRSPVTMSDRRLARILRFEDYVPENAKCPFLNLRKLNLFYARGIVEADNQAEALRIGLFKRGAELDHLEFLLDSSQLGVRAMAAAEIVASHRHDAKATLFDRAREELLRGPNLPKGSLNAEWKRLRKYLQWRTVIFALFHRPIELNLVYHAMHERLGIIDALIDECPSASSKLKELASFSTYCLAQMSRGDDVPHHTAYHKAEEILRMLGKEMLVTYRKDTAYSDALATLEACKLPDSSRRSIETATEEFDAALRREECSGPPFLPTSGALKWLGWDDLNGALELKPWDRFERLRDEIMRELEQFLNDATAELDGLLGRDLKESTAL